MTAVADYFADVTDRLTGLHERQAGAIASAADLGASALQDRRPLFLFDTGHLLTHELIARTGGLAAYTALPVPRLTTVANDFVQAQRQPTPDQLLRATQALVIEPFEQGLLTEGDLLFISSVSGTKPAVVELAQQARSRGLGVIAITGVEFSHRLPPDHPSQTRLCENADVVLDCETPYGDAALPMPELAQNVAPWSGLAAGLLMWAVTVGIVEACLKRGLTPTVFTSYNLPAGAAAYQQARDNYRQNGI